MSVKVTFKFEGSGAVPALRVKDSEGEYHRIRLQGGSGSFQAELEEAYKLFWFVVGEPATEYTITMSAATGFKVVAKRNPIKPEGGIPDGGAGYGRERFRVEEGESQ